jgi:hypothetical protein
VHSEVESADTWARTLVLVVSIDARMYATHGWKYVCLKLSTPCSSTSADDRHHPEAHQQTSNSMEMTPMRRAAAACSMASSDRPYMWPNSLGEVTLDMDAHGWECNHGYVRRNVDIDGTRGYLQVCKKAPCSIRRSISSCETKQ